MRYSISVIFFSILEIELSEVEGVLATGNEDDSCTLTIVWVKTIIDLLNVFNKKIALLDGLFFFSYFHLHTELRVIEGLEPVITLGVNLIPTIGLSFNPKTIVLCNFVTSNSLVACVCLSFIAESNSNCTLLTWMANYATTTLKSSYSI